MKGKVLFVLIICLIALLAGCSQPDNFNPPEPRVEAPDLKPCPHDPIEPSIPVTPAELLILDKLTIEEKIGQVLIAGIPESTSLEQVYEYVDAFKIGGFILYPRNYSNLEELYTLVSSIKKYNSENPLPLFISTDEEGGTVSRLPKGATKFPDARLVGRVNNLELTKRVGEVIGTELYTIGINMNFAPVLDIVDSSNNKFLYKRTFGSDAEAVYRHGTAFIGGLQSKNVIAAAKHFPGHGATTVDSHGKLPVIDIEKATLLERELAPYIKCFNDGLDAVMAGHLSFPKIDPSGRPASMSKVFLTDILREELGFEGIVIMDDIEMYGFLGQGESFESSVIEAFNAGIDVFLICHTKKVQANVLKALKSGLEDGRISMERLDEAVLRVITMKLKYEVSDEVKYSLEEVKQILSSEQHKSVYDTLMEKDKALK